MPSVYQFQKLSADALDMSMVSCLDKVNYSGRNWTLPIELGNKKFVGSYVCAYF